MKKEKEIVRSPKYILVIEDGKIIEKVEIGKDPKECAEKYVAGEVDKIIEMLKEKHKAVISKKPLDISLLIKEGLFKDEREFDKFNREFSLWLAKLSVKEKFTPDKLAIQAANFLDDLNEIINRIYERLSEWYGFYFPEFVKKCDKMEKFFKILSQGVKREEVAKKFEIKAESMGYDFSERDLDILHEIAVLGKELMNLKESIAKYIRKVMEAHYYNLAKVAGPIIGAKLLSLAGGIENLAKMPASTIQVLGAEKALFRHLTKGTKPPKHGILFQHPLVSKMPRKLRGKIARTLASKIAIAARVDYYSKGKEKVAEKLLKEIEERVEEIRGGK